MTAAELVRQLLVDAPGDALCDACLALACGTTLTEMREITGGLTAADPAIQRAATCASCRRTVAAVVFEVPLPKCAHCGGPLNEGEDGVIIDGDRFHDVCMRRLITDETIRVSRRLSRQSRELIEQSRRRLRNPESDATT